MGTPRGGGGWLVFRAAVALALAGLFYLLALAIAVGLGWAGLAMLLGGKGVNVWLLLVTFGGSIAILWGIFPRFDRFQPPGPRLDRSEQPRLFAEIDAVAEAVGQEPPADVYLAGDVNAGVMERGGMLGFGGRRVMVLGLPLMATLRVSEFRGVLAHEFGHFHGGETRLGPRIHGTRAAIGRTVHMLNETNSLIRPLFEAYGKFYCRVTEAISRRQELLADEIAAEAAGASALASGLRATAAAATAFGPFYGSEVAPMLDAGFRPPLAEGFRRFLAARPIADALKGHVEEVIREEKADPYDSHPPLRERLRALGDPAPEPPAAADPLAATLLEGIDGLEQSIFEMAFPGVTIPPPLRWEEAATRAFLPKWREQVKKEAPILRGLRPETLPEALHRIGHDPRWRRLAAQQEQQQQQGRGPPKLAFVAATSMLLHLHARGWTVRAEPGREVALQRGDETCFPYQEVADLALGTTTVAGWKERCRLLGIEGQALDVLPGVGEGAA